MARAVLNASKRLSKKRAAGDDTPATPTKRRRNSADLPITQTPAELEASLQLPSSQLSPEELGQVILTTNRAPLLLAFAYAALEYTMPGQPVSSKLSLAQAVVSAGSRAKAVSIGLAKRGEGAEDQGWGDGQPVVKVLGREVRVLRRWGYEWKEAAQVKQEETAEDSDTTHDDKSAAVESEEPALWAIDLEKLKQLNGPLTFATIEHTGGETSGLPVYSAQSAQSYVLRAFETYTAPSEDDGVHGVEANEGKEKTDLRSKKGKKTGAAVAHEKSENLGKLLQTLHMLFGSWAGQLSKGELDQRAWSWYVRVRPEVEQGVSGWGAKGQVKLQEILDLRRQGNLETGKQ